MTCQSDVIFLRKNEISIYTFKCSGIMENWIKHELFHSNNEVSWWHDMTHDNMSSHDIRHMTSRHDFMSIKFDIWLLLYVAVSELERWFYFCFAQYLGREIHSYYRRLGDLHACIHAWPWNWRSRHGLRDLCYLCLYLSYRDDFLLFRKDFRSGNSFQLSPFAWPSRLTLKLNVTSWSTWHMSFLPVFVLPQRFFFVL